MKIKVKKWRRYTNLFVGIAWSILGVAFIFEGETPNWLDYLYFFISVTYIVHFLYDQKHHYVVIENGVIKPNRLYGMKTKIRTDKIQSVSKKWGEYKIETGDKSLTLNTQLIDEKSLEDLKKFLQSLNLPEDKIAL